MAGDMAALSRMEHSAEPDGGRSQLVQSDTHRPRGGSCATPAGAAVRHSNVATAEVFMGDKPTH